MINYILDLHTLTVLYTILCAKQVTLRNIIVIRKST